MKIETIADYRHLLGKTFVSALTRSTKIYIKEIQAIETQILIHADVYFSGSIQSEYRTLFNGQDILHAIETGIFIPQESIFIHE